ncbi:type II toxin-antitoxin system VapB family antitoxin [Iamia sp.]|jgi:Arc/MetJ family transcription regulator|uniref:type II toxin-antitoxin system VapB family antitoxin n=1 Tax=Iamia sp. TaxID=2722710 RepID=UPI002B7612DA|nr:type II toxin-antitoxin system VapB family antitoxin [Iamia sp.]HXH57501.1 type II toxin-antitoxin system VapB family antitoxin [Iamia sp.]
MRTNIEIDDELMAEARAAAGAATKRETVELALRELVRRRSRRSTLGLRGTVEWSGDLDASRSSR